MNKHKLISVWIILGLIFVTPAFAESGSDSKGTKMTVNILPVITLTLSTNNLTINNLAPGTMANSNSLAARVITNNQTGYTLSVTAGNSTNPTTNLVHASASTFFSSLATTGTFTTSTFTADSWGFSTDAGANYRGLPLYTAEPLMINESEGPADATTNFLVGAKASATMTSGEYSNVITFTAVTNYVPDTRTLADITEMQEMNPDICANTTEATGTNGQYQLKDTRDNKLYYVAKLADGKCWMTQNLDLNLSTATALTSIDSNVTDSWTPARSTITTGNLSSSTWTDDNNTPYSYDPGDTYVKEDTKYTSLSACTSAGNSESDCKHYHTGNYYNWSAAVAMNDTNSLTTRFDNASTSICPKGWRLPMGYDGTNGDFKTLNSKYGNSTSSDAALIVSPLWFVRPGYVWSGLLDAPGVFGYYWSSTVFSGTSAYYLTFDSGYVSPTSNNVDRGLGFSVRCVAQ